MNENRQEIVRPDTRFYNENRTKIPPEDLLPYAGQWLAWSPDGTRILAHGKEIDAVEHELQAQGIAASAVVWEELPSLDAEDSWL
jgi:hypothetical protein